MEVTLELGPPKPVAAIKPVLSLANDEGSGRWITVGGAHIFIKDGGGSKEEQVANFLSKRAGGSGKSEDHADAASAHADKAKKTGALEDHASVVAHQYSGTAYDALKGSVKQKMDEAHEKITAGMKHVQDVADKVKNYPGEKLAQAKDIVNKGVQRTQEIAKAAAEYPGKKLAEAKKAIGDKAKAIGEDVGAKKSWLASKFHSAAAIGHQVAADLHGLTGNHIMQSAHNAMAEKHLDERDKHLAVVADHASKVAAAHTAASPFGKDIAEMDEKLNGPRAKPEGGAKEPAEKPAATEATAKPGAKESASMETAEKPAPKVDKKPEGGRIESMPTTAMHGATITHTKDRGSVVGENEVKDKKMLDALKSNSDHPQSGEFTSLDFKQAAISAESQAKRLDKGEKGPADLYSSAEEARGHAQKLREIADKMDDPKAAEAAASKSAPQATPQAAPQHTPP